MSDIILHPITVPNRAVVLRAEIVQQVDALVAELEAAPPITDQASMDQVRGVLTKASALLKQIETERKAAQKPFDQVIQAIRSAAKPVTERLEAVVAECKMQIATALAQQEAAARKAEAERLAALAASNSGLPQVPVVALPTQLLEAATQTRKEVVVVDASQVPDQYWVLDMAKIKADALAGAVIPGVEVREVRIVVAR